MASAPPTLSVRLASIALAGAAVTLTGGTVAGAASVDAPPEAWHVRALHLAEAHRLARGGGVVVAVLDSAVLPHRDLSGALLSQIDVATAGLRGDSASGDSARDESARDDSASGTELAGLIAARGDGRTGLLGVAPQAKILPIRVSGQGFDAEPDAVAAGIERAVDAGAAVILSTYSRPELTGSLAAAVRRAVAADAVLVAPAGPATSSAPALADLPGVVCVTGVGQDGRPQRDSVRGLRLDVAAPADQLVAPVRASLGDAYTQVSGAEYAAALVAGVAALVRSRYPDLSAGDVARRLHRHDQRDIVLGWGPVDAADALTRPLAELPTPRPTQTDPATGWLPRDRQWYLDAIGIPDAHRVTRGDAVTVGLVAGKIDTARPDLDGRLDQQVWVNADGTAVAAAETAPRPADTAAAVLVAGSGGDGYLGAAPAARLIAASGGSEATATQVDAAVRWLVDHGATVILAIDGARSLSPIAVGYALSHNAIVIAPQDEDSPGVPGVITVGGVRLDEVLNSGRPPTLTAPGDVNLLLDDGHAASASPAESAAALVAGVAALVRARYPDADTNTTIQRILSTATPVDGDPSVAYGRGIVNPVGALTAHIAPATANPLGEPRVPPGSGTRDGRPWAVIGAGIGVAMILVGLLIWILRRRRRNLMRLPA